MTALLEMQSAYVVPRTSLEEALINSNEFPILRAKVLTRCLEERRYFLSEKNQGDVGEGIAQEDFEDNFFAGWDDGFLASYKHRSEIKPGKKRTSCDLKKLNPPTIIELKLFINNYRKVIEQEFGRKISFNEAYDHFNNRYFEGWRAGFKSGFCALGCPKRNDCNLAENYRVD